MSDETKEVLAAMVAALRAENNALSTTVFRHVQAERAYQQRIHRQGQANGLLTAKNERLKTALDERDQRIAEQGAVINALTTAINTLGKEPKPTERGFEVIARVMYYHSLLKGLTGKGLHWSNLKQVDQEAWIERAKTNHYLSREELFENE